MLRIAFHRRDNTYLTKINLSHKIYLTESVKWCHKCYLTAVPVSEILFIISILFGYIIAKFTPTNVLMWQFCSEIRVISLMKSQFKELFIQSYVFFSTGLLGICIPQLDNFMALVGSISGVAVGLILPPLLNTLCFWRQGLSRLQLIINITIMVIGIFAFITGTLSTIYSIMHRYIHHPNATKLFVHE